MEELIAQMLTAFANNFRFYLKTHNYHWIVNGVEFPQYHEFLKKIYEDAQGSIDDYAERIRQLGAYPLGDLEDIQAESEIQDPTDQITDPQAIFQNIADDLDILITRLQDTYDAAQAPREYGVQNFLADRIDAHKQQLWMVNSILGQTP